MSSVPIRPVNIANGAPIRPNTQGQQVRPMRPPMPASPMALGQRPHMPGAASVPQHPGNMMRPPGSRPILPAVQQQSHAQSYSHPGPQFQPQVQMQAHTQAQAQAQTQNNLISPMQNLNLKQQTSNKPRRVYANSSEIAPQVPPKEPWPNSLQNQQPHIRPTHASSSAGLGYTNGPYSNTDQPLPPELRPPTQPRPRIDPDQMPAPVAVRELDEELFSDKFFSTIDRERVPLSTTQCIALDQGNCNSRFIRATVDRIPCSKDLADKSKIPLGLVIQPLAKQRSDEVGIHVVDHGPEGPIRCTRCRAYMNPWCLFTHGGSRFECNLCKHSNEVPSGYFANIDMSGRRIDINERPELQYGSVEFEVPKEYHSERPPTPLNYVFALDVSILAIQSGMLEAVCESLRFALYDSQGNAKLNNRIGIVTFDKDVQFYNLSASLSRAQMLVVSDIEDVFVPLQAGFLADPQESKDIILGLLNTLPSMFKDTIRAESVYTSAIKGGLEALKSTGGHLFVFQSCLPNYGVNALKPREDKSLYGTEKERSLLVSQSEAYKQLGKDCVKNGVCVHTWAFPTQYMDLVTMHSISHLTGGDVRYYPEFKPKDKISVINQLDRDLHRETGFDGVLRVRCSDGLQVMDHYGACHMSTYTDMDLAGIDETKAMVAILKHDGKLDLSRGVAFQCAFLYTTRQGQRRVRVHNLQLAATSQIADVFRYGDVDATISVMLRQSIFDLSHKNRKDIHTRLTDSCVDVLTAYRNNCAASTSQGQLILPEAFKLLPVYVHGAMRSAVLRGVGVDMNIDARVFGMCKFNTLSVSELVWSLYPRMFALHTMKEEDGMAKPDGSVQLPAMIRLSYERLQADGAYVVDTGSSLFLWLGKKVPQAFLEEMFSVSTLAELDPHMTTLPALQTSLSQKSHSILNMLQHQRPNYLAFSIVRQELDPIEFLFSTFMSEDRNAEVQTYVDYMCVLHRKIQEEMKKLNS